MPTKKRQSKTSIDVGVNKELAPKKDKTLEKANRKKMNNLQREICRNILDAGEVTKSQVSGDLVPYLTKAGTSKKELKEVLGVINSKIDMQTNQLVDRIVKSFAG